MFFYIIFSSMILMDLLWWLWADARLRPLKRAGLWRTLLGLFIGTLTACMLGFLLFPAGMRRAHGVLPVPLHALVYLWHLGILPLTCILLLLYYTGRTSALLAMCLRGGRTGRAAEKAAAADPFDPPADAPAGLSRRQFLGATVAALPPLVATGVTGYGVSRLNYFRINHQVVPIPDLPPDLDGLRIAHVSDVHVGKFTFGGQLARIAEAANRNPEGERPHLTLLTGDLIDLSVSDLPAATDFVRKLDPLHGLAMCEGNHDLIESPRSFYEGVGRAGVPLLLDQTSIVKVPGSATPVQVMGMRWSVPGVEAAAAGPGRRPRGGESQIPAAMARLLPQRRPDAFPILLAHHPHAFDAAIAADIPLTLAGHTHGGQVRVGSFNPASRIYRYWSGLYRRGNSHCFVSNGVGNWFPLRIGSPAEVVHLTLRRA